ncbi:MAG TPA: hypothetical protein VI612_03110 [Candidatus Nanoarchaeia archaeon]|nr:hypothetical protein [Candidatus Nanoarchaeia archaeon]
MDTPNSFRRPSAGEFEERVIYETFESPDIIPSDEFIKRYKEMNVGSGYHYNYGYRVVVKDARDDDGIGAHLCGIGRPGKEEPEWVFTVADNKLDDFEEEGVLQVQVLPGKLSKYPHLKEDLERLYCAVFGKKPIWILPGNAPIIYQDVNVQGDVGCLGLITKLFGY